MVQWWLARWLTLGYEAIVYIPVPILGRRTYKSDQCAGVICFKSSFLFPHPPVGFMVGVLEVPICSSWLNIILALSPLSHISLLFSRLDAWKVHS